MLQELSHMDRITQLQDEIQQVRAPAVCWVRVLTAGALHGAAPDDNVEQRGVLDVASELLAGGPRRTDHEGAQPGQGRPAGGVRRCVT